MLFVYSYVESEVIDLIKAENQMVGSQDWGQYRGKNGRG